MIDSDVKLCSLALSQLGLSRITSFTENENAYLCEMLYQPVIDQALREHPWRFALTRQALAPLSDDKFTIYEYMYQLPLDPPCIRAVVLLDEDYIERPDTEFVIEGGRLYTDLENASLKYVGRPATPKDFDSHFVWYAVFLLAARMAETLGRIDKQKDLEILAMSWLSKAKAEDAGEGSQRLPDKGFWTEEG